MQALPDRKPSCADTCAVPPPCPVRGRVLRTCGTGRLAPGAGGGTAVPAASRVPYVHREGTT
eukprot:scaffold3751_cov55-Phaeocystis_antarctica.AAC.3